MTTICSTVERYKVCCQPSGQDIWWLIGYARILSVHISGGGCGGVRAVNILPTKPQCEGHPINGGTTGVAFKDIGRHCSSVVRIEVQ